MVGIGDEFGRGAAIRIMGVPSVLASRLEGDRPWTDLTFEFEQSDDGPVWFVVEVRASAGEAWFEAETIRVEAR